MALQDRLARLPVVGVGLAVQRRYLRDAADPLAAAIAFFGFLSLFPLLLLAVSTAGFFLTDPDDQIAVAVALTEMIPGFEMTLELGGADRGAAALVEGIVARRGTIGVVGIVTLVLAGLKVINAAMAATRVVFRGEVMTGVVAKLRQLAALAALGAVALLAVAGSSLAATGIGVLPATLAVGISLGITFLLDLGLFLAAYTWLSPTSSPSPRQLLPGAVLAATGWSVLKVGGSTVLGAQFGGGNALYGALGGVVALLLLLYLAGRLYLYGAELSAVLIERRDGPLVAPGPDLASAAEPDAASSAEPAAAWAAEPDAASAAEPAAASSAEPDAASNEHPDPGWEPDPDPEGPPPVPALARTPRPRDPGPTAPSPTVGAQTRERLAVAEGDRLEAANGRDRGADARTLVAYGLGAAALATAWRFLGAGRE